MCHSGIVDGIAHNVVEHIVHSADNIPYVFSQPVILHLPLRRALQLPHPWT